MLSLGVNASNQINNTGFSYDVSGNMTNDGTNGYNWDAESQIKSAAGVNYLYDGDGNRVQKSNGKIYWYGAGSEVLDESDLSGNFTDEYVFFGGKRIAHRVVSSNTIYYYAEDFLGSSRVITTATGSVCYDADFLPYGTEHTVTNTCPQNYKFTGKERDSETGNDDFGARYYSSSLGRWLSPDWSAVPAPVPYANLTNPQTLNLYAMVRDNPEAFADLDGHEDEGGGGDASASDSSATSSGDSGQDGPDKKNGAQPATTGSPQNTTAQPNQNQAPEHNQDQNQQPDKDKQQTPSPAAAGGGKGGGQQPKGERRLTGKPEFKDKPGKQLPKGVKPNPDKPGQYPVWDSHKGTWLEKPKGWSPDTVKKVAVGVGVVGTVVAIIKIAAEACLLGACYP